MKVKDGIKWICSIALAFVLFASFVVQPFPWLPDDV